MLKTRLQNHAAQMAPHQRQRTGGKLILDSIERITQLENEMAYLVAVIEANLECGTDPRVKYAKTLLAERNA